MAWAVLGAAIAAWLPACDTSFTPDLRLRDGGPGGVIVPQPDASNDAGNDAGADGGGPAVCEDAVCDPVAGLGCAAPAQCVLQGEQVACGTAGEAGEGDPCEAPGDCALGLACFRVSDTEAACGRVCCGELDPCGAHDQKCAPAQTLVGDLPTPWGRCVDRVDCDPRSSGGVCGEGQSCYVVSGSGSTDCLPTGEGLRAAACSRAEDCAPGLVCAGAGGAQRTCRALCDLGAEDTGCDAALERCVAYAYTPAGAGVCTPK